jgi:hypothetical protein
VCLFVTTSESGFKVLLFSFAIVLFTFTWWLSGQNVLYTTLVCLFFYFYKCLFSS